MSWRPSRLRGSKVWFRSELSEKEGGHMYRKMLLCLCLLLTLGGAAMARDKSSPEKGPQDKATAAKQLSGMSIFGNDEAPKSLYLVPWKRSEIGAATGLNKMLTESAVPVDREEFMRQLDLYEISTKK
jgi:hypothetical protein